MGYTNTAARIVAIVTALLLIGGGTRAHAAATLDQLVVIDSLIAQRDWGALWSFVIANPALTAGDDPLAIELRNFLISMNVGNVDVFAASSPIVQSRGRPY
ncbi:MAG: hypothetical protein ACKVPY_00955 [Paracoccaceae bacterium]